MAEKRRDKKGRILRKGEQQRSDGRYMYRYTNMSGERQVEYSWRLVASDPQPQGRKKELSLREKEALIEQDRYDMISTSYGSMTVNELFDFYVKMKQKRGKITVRTIENYTKIWNKNMRKRKFAGMSIQAVRKTHILDCYQEMLEDGVGNGSITLIHKVLSAMFNHAVSEDYIRRNYAHGCTKELGIYNNKRDALTQAQQAEFLNFIKENKEYSPYYWMFEFFLETGCRSGEGTGLLWENVDFRNKFIKIDHQLLYELDEEGKRRFQICPPKTIKGIRKIPLTAKALQALKKQKEYLLKHGMLENFTVDSQSGFVFLTKRFQLWSAAQLDIILHRIVYDYNSIEVANAIIEDREPELLPNITAHILRHTACTRMAEAGMDQRTLQEIMGHSNLAITMKVYNHVDDKRMREEIEKFDAKRDGKEKVS